MSKIQVPAEIIENFLNGSNPKKYVVAIEASYSEPHVDLIINDPVKGKYIERHQYKPFLWFKHDVKNLLYGGKNVKTLEASQKYGVKSKRLINNDGNGNIPKRLENGYCYLATCKNSYNDLINFFKAGGVDVFDKETSKLFFMFTPVEQFMIQTGIRLFKGFDDYDDLHRFQFDLETDGLFGNKNCINQIGVRDNKGFEYVFETVGNTAEERRESEKRNIVDFFKTINKLKPDIISGYNSEGFDWKFIIDRAERLALNLDSVAVGINKNTKLKRKPSMLKLGNEMEPFEQTYLYGYNVIDIAHSVRRAQAINSNIKSWGLKYITQYSDIAKKNRVYVSHDKIHSTWSDSTESYAFNDENGDWYKISDRMQLSDGYKAVTGTYIVQRYLLDDLWETEKVDVIFNQAAFLIAKLLPTTYSRSSTMGTASQWKLIMAAWSYENNLAIPETEKKRDFTGGLSRLLEVGYAKNVVKLDYAALYPKNQLTNSIFPDLDISGVMEGLLTYVVDTRDKFKFLTSKHKDICKKIKKEIEQNEGTYTKEKIHELKEELKKNKDLESLYDKKQLPLKILANSWFGAYGAPYIFNWGDSDCAEETTCRGRQYLRLMVKHFSEKYGFKPLVGDTDGFNFAFPDNINDVKYLAKGSHWKTTEYADQELIGLDAVLAEFNETYMIGRMGLDIDDICNSTINFSRKNYANDIGGKIKFVGNSIKSKKMPVYIEDFLSKAIRLLLDGKGKEFINYYYEYVDKIYNYGIPLVKIASKSKVKTSLSEYKKKRNSKNKAGNPMPKQAHMELAINNNLNINLADTIYYVNTGKSKNDGDVTTVDKNKMTKKEAQKYFEEHKKYPKPLLETVINCKLIDKDIVESNLEMIKEIESLKKIMDKESDELKKESIQEKINEIDSLLLKEEYNVAKYLESLNKKVKPLLVCFHPDIRSKILLTIKKDKETNLDKLTQRCFFTESDCTLVSGMPEKPEDQDSYDELMTLEDKEIKFWVSVNKIPNDIGLDQWEKIKNDFFLRKEEEKISGVIYDKEKFEEIIKRFEYADYKNIRTNKTLPEVLLTLLYVNENGDLISKKWDKKIADFLDIFTYEDEAIKRNNWYQLENLNSLDRYEQWLEYKQTLSEIEINEKNDIIDIDIKTIVDNTKNISDNSEVLVKKKKQKDEEDGEDVDEVIIDHDDFDTENQKLEFEVEVGNKINVIIDSSSDDVEEEILPTLVLAVREIIKNIDDSEYEVNDNWNF
jgi:DNA polymerase I